MPRKKNSRRKSGAPKRTPEQQILEREVLPFDAGRFAHMPYNAFTGHQYAGMSNLLMLTMRCWREDWKDPRFVTVGKAKEIGADFRGQATTSLWLPVPIKELNEDTGEKETVGVRFRSFRAFNVEQFANRGELDIPPLPRSRWGDAPVAARIEAMKKHLMANFNNPPLILERMFLEAPCYTPGLHAISLPPMSEYSEPGAYARSLVHEVVHATGAKSEMNRFAEYSPDFCSFRADEYAREEMLTQFATASLLTQYGFRHENKSSAGYILSWYKAIENQPDALGMAIKHAAAVVRHILKDSPLPDFSADSDGETEDLTARPAA